MHRSKHLAHFFGRSLRATLPCLGLAALTFSCSREHHAADEQLGQAAAAINANPKVGDFAVYAVNSISLGEQSLVVGGDIGVINAGPGPFLVPGFALALGEKSQVNPARNLLAVSVLLGENALVGDIQTNHLLGNHAAHGSVTSFVTLPALPAVSPVTVGTADLTVPERRTLVLAAGSSLKNVKIGASCTVRLAGGTYQMAQLTVGENSRIEALATAQIHVAGRLSVGDSAFVGPTSASLTARDLRIEVSGSNGAGGGLSGTPVAASFGEKDQVHAVMLVPNGSLQVGDSALAYGALFGRDVKIGEKSQITFQDGFGASGCPASCDDGNACTDDACVAGSCAHTPKATGTSCDDGNACTLVDTCQAGACVGANPVVCTALDQCHAAGTCDPTTGACSNPALADGTSCNDGNACTQSDACQAGNCVGTNPLQCVALDQCHAAGTCDPSTGQCSDPAAPDGTSCSDGNACTQTDRCLAGTCTGSNLVACAPSDRCHVAGICDSSTGICSNPSQADGASCDDGNACTSGDSCQSGACRAGTPIAVDDNNPCTADSCDPSTGVKHTPTAVGSSCSDGNACNGSETCDGNGACRPGTSVVCAASDQCHQVGACDPSSGMCSNPAKPDGTSCNDGNACTPTDQCVAGACSGTNPVICTASDECHQAGSCDSVTGICSNPTKADGSSCDDGNACTSGDACLVGSCHPGTAVVIDDNNPCTTDSCEPIAGIQHTPASLGSSCSDGNVCNGAETCDGAGHCQPGTAVTVDDGKPCTIDACDPTTGNVTHSLASAGTSCSAGNLCNGGATCQADGSCVAGPSPIVDDGNPCTIDACDPATGVTHLARVGASCSDGDFCNGEETCNAAGQCVSGPPAVIDDGDPCTIDLCTTAFGVQHVRPDPPPAAFAIDPTVASSVFDTSKYIDTGECPLQKNLTDTRTDAEIASGGGALGVDPARVSVIRGNVYAVGGAAFAGVRVTVVNHASLGDVLSSMDGHFEMLVNAGTSLTLRYQHDGFLTVQRQILPRAADYTIASDVFMTRLDANLTPVELNQSSSAVARGSVINDADGVRQATILFPPNTSGTMTDVDGNVVPLPGTVHVRATEYTTVAGGPNAMPAELPPSSAFTYAVELNLEEAEQLGATSVNFTDSQTGAPKTLQVYIENFLHLPVGTVVPSGYYDRQAAQWIASTNGSVIKITSIVNGAAQVDVDGNGAPGSTIGMTTDELTRLAGLYAPSQELWRTPVTHFTPGDLNFPYGPPQVPFLPITPTHKRQGRYRPTVSPAQSSSVKRRNSASAFPSRVPPSR